MNTMTRAARHVATTAGPGKRAVQTQIYRNRDDRSTVDCFQQAGEVLFLLAVFTLDTVERAGFSLLLERRLRRVYEGGYHE